MKYAFDEDKYLQELTDYINSTYNQHYVSNKTGSQVLDVAIDRGRAMDFILTNIDKYSGRYGKKGSVSTWRGDLVKLAHYAILALYVHDLEHATKSAVDLDIDLDLVDDDSLDIGDIYIGENL